MRYAWTRTLYNGYEPNNRITFIAEKEPDGKTYTAAGLIGNLSFRDGPAFCCITRASDGFHWETDLRSGVAESFEAAWSNLQALVTHADHFEESEIFELPGVEEVFA
ncbi:MAG TPA: hypothetical protein V6D10_07360 [Trichocoleus sp.]|jgi:hypothetical protein